MFDVTTPLGKNIPYNHGDECLKYGEKTGDYRGRCYVRRTSEGWVWYCHNCGGKGFVPYGVNDLLQICKNKELLEHEVQTNTDYWEPEADEVLTGYVYDWLENYIYPSEIYRVVSNYKFYGNDRLGWLVMPIFGRDGIKLGWQARNFNHARDKKQPKYITKKKPNLDQPFCFRAIGHNPVCVLVEDIISAVRVGEITDSYAILGSPTRIPSDVATELTKYYDKVIVWYDSDKWSAAKNVANQLTTCYGLATGTIVTEKDPKELGEYRIQQLLKAV